MEVSEVEEKVGGWRYKYLEQEGESKMCHYPSSVGFSVLLLHLKFTGRHGERWTDGEREGGVCRCPLKGKEHLDSLSCTKTSHVRLFFSRSRFLSFDVFLLLVYTFIYPVNLFLPSPLAAPFPSYIQESYQETVDKITTQSPEKCWHCTFIET